MFTVTVRHNAEMGHRLPHLPGKCQSLHGHSWWFEVEIEGPLRADGTVVEFAALKAQLRRWIDDNLDHGMALYAKDPLLAELVAADSKTYVPPNGYYPTVEVMAYLVGKMMDDWCRLDTGHARVVRCTATETSVNQATWRPS